MLPRELLEYLSDPRNRPFKFDLELEITEGIFYEPSAIVLKSFKVDSAALYSNGHLDYYPEEMRSYQAYDLIEEVNDYSPDGILVWFPELNQFGSCDTDHCEIIVFPSATWSQVDYDLHLYLNAIWYTNMPWLKDRIDVAYLNPWKSEPPAA
jgi:hypothetical protein